MGYLFNNGRGFLAGATAVGTASYLFVTSGYLNDTIRIGYNDSGDRIIDDGGTIENFACATDSVQALQAIESPTHAANTLYSTAILDGAKVEAVECFYDSYNELENIDIE